MPEGDTIHRSANRLASALVGRPVRAFEATRLVAAGPSPGAEVVSVTARGKYLLIGFTDGWVLETHMKMTGSWHLYRPGERWRRSPRSARVVLHTDDWVAVCFSAPHVELHRPRPGPGPSHLGPSHLGPDLCRPDTGPGPSHLGPDLCGPDPDLDEVERRVAALFPAHTPTVDVLLDQRVFCGVGNVYKSEVLHAEGIHPDAPLGSLEPGALRRLAATAHRLLRANLGGGPRVTVPGGLAVYGRAGRPCRRCGTPVAQGRRGPHQRSTYWCPRCQLPPAHPSAH